MALLLTGMAIQAQQFTLTGNIPGLKEGCKVRLRAVRGYDERDITEGTTVRNGFILKGKVNGPTLASIEIDDKPMYAEHEYAKDRGVKFMLDNVDMTLEAPCFDSIPRNYEMGGTPLKLERHVKVTGGDVQRHYQEWRDFIYDAELSAWYVDNLLWKYRFGHDSPREQKDEQTLALMENAARAAQNTVAHLNGSFIRKHPTYAISLILQGQRMEDMFTLTGTELDETLALLKDNEDKAGYERLATKVAHLRRFTKGTPYTDFDVRTPDGTKKHFSDYIVRGRYNYIDMWASWCGPCRAAIPEVKQMYKKLGDRLNVISLSVDKEDAAWKRAMDDEQMPWTQLIADTKGVQTLRDAYELSSIPYLLVIDPEGRVVLSTHEPVVAEEFLKQHIEP